MSLILGVSRELKTEAEGLRRKISQQDTLEREMLKQYFCKNVPYPGCVQGVED
jgi:hypothetical protein